MHSVNNHLPFGIFFHKGAEFGFNLTWEVEFLILPDVAVVRLPLRVVRFEEGEVTVIVVHNIQVVNELMGTSNDSALFLHMKEILQIRDLPVDLDHLLELAQLIQASWLIRFHVFWDF